MAVVIKYKPTLPTLNADDSYAAGQATRSLIYSELRTEQLPDHVIVYLFRHGEAIEDEKELFGGWNQSPLTEHGVAAVTEAAKAFSIDHVFGLIFTDDLLRTIQTAEILLPYSQTATELIINEMARSWGIGDTLSGKPKNDENEAIKDQYVLDPDKVPEGGNAESLNQSKRRFLQFLAYVISVTPKDMPSVIACHSGNIKTTTDTYGHKIRIKPSGIVALHITEHGIRIEVIRKGVVTHLRADQEERCYGDMELRSGE